MKKILLTVACATVIFSAKAQSNQKSTSQMLPSSAVNNSAKEDPHNPLVNGIPYNQYKIKVQAEDKSRNAAEQEAITKHQEWMNKQTKKNLPPIPNIAEKAKIDKQLHANEQKHLIKLSLH